MAAHVLAGKGKHGFDDRHRGQMMIVTGKTPLCNGCYPLQNCEQLVKELRTGPLLCAGKELAEAVSKALGAQIEFENISE